MTWLSGQRSEMARDRILDTAARLFAERGVDGPGMDEVASEAGCSRATLYRYFANRHALQVAFAQREAAVIVAEVATEIRSIRGPRARRVAAVMSCLRAVRSRSHLTTWYAADGASVLNGVLRESVIADLAAADTKGTDSDLARWMLRVIVSFLTDPGADEAEERRLLERFLPVGEAVPAR